MPGISREVGKNKDFDVHLPEFEMLLTNVNIVQGTEHTAGDLIHPKR